MNPAAQADDVIAQRMDQFMESLRRAGVKLTHQRIEIFREVLQTSEHPDAETIYYGVRKRIPTISLDTVYRTLMLLIDLGLITNLHPPHERMRFDANTNTHHHFVCTKCGMIRDFSNPNFDMLSPPEAVHAFGLPQCAHVEFRGLCWTCAQQNPPELL